MQAVKHEPRSPPLCNEQRYTIIVHSSSPRQPRSACKLEEVTE